MRSSALLEMRYFTFDLISKANDWTKQTESAHRKAEQAFESAAKKYHRELDTLEPRISRDAFKFFRNGFGRDGLHDARLLSLRVGDGLNYKPDGSKPFLINHQQAAAIIEFLNYEQDLHYVFDLRGLSRFNSDLMVEKQSYAKSLGDLYIYELTAADDNRLQLGFLFASGATMVAQFKKLVFRRSPVARSYELGEIYD